ncbi:unnamed protein product [Urochloa decumbens]|uniref:Uncharacterized protein n=1 Tax=Urochloa decumbens TaxID=240449 RepID=A0ABC8VZ92_9POAL
MARRRLHQPSRRVPTSLLLLAGLTAAVAVAFAIAAAAGGQENEPDIRISVTYPTEEESEWLDRWAEKYRAKKPGSGFSVEPATYEESAYLNRIFADGKKGGGGRAGGFDGRVEFDNNDRPRIVVDKYHSGPRSSEPNVDLENKEESHAEHDVMEL